MDFNYKKNAFVALFALLFLTKTATAQTPTDGIMMDRGEVCAALMAGQDSWKNYWEGSLKRDNSNLGEVTSTMVMPMAAFGLTDKINLIAGVPWFKNEASAGTLKAEQGFQDFFLSAKIRPFSREIGSGKLDLMANLGVSAPVRKYTADYLPLCVGLHSKTASARAIFQYRLHKGFLIGGQAGYTSRSNVEIDRSFYYVGDKPFYTNKVDMPNVVDYSATVGFLNHFLKVNLNYMVMDTRSSSDIRRNDMPFISNNMDASRVTGIVQYYLPRRIGLSFILTGGYTISGRNVGQATSIGGGLAYQFGVYKKPKMDAAK